jgi:dihydroorotase (multifunctional complex type)
VQVDTVLFNAKIYTSQRIVEAGLAIENAKIVKIAKETNLPKASNRIDIKGNLVIPGLIDSHVHLRDQELAYREDFTTGTAAAAAGGVTTVIDMPNNRPVTMSAEALRKRMELAEKRVLVNTAFNSAFPSTKNEIHDIVKQGAVGFKLYLLQQIGGVNIDDDIALKRAFNEVARANIPICVHAEDKATLEQAKERIQKTGKNNAEAFLKAHPATAESKAIQHAAKLAKNSGVHIHVCHVSSAAGLNEIIEAKRKHANITCEVTPHHLLLTSDSIKIHGNVALMLPPLRTKRDVEALWKALRKDTIDTVASDHAPHSLEEKTAKSVWDIKPGIAGLETLLPLMLNEVNRGRLTINHLIRLTAEKPAEIFHLESRGSLNEGYVADLTVVDLKREHKIEASRFLSKAKFSPFDGWKVKGKVVKTFVSGQLIMDEGEIVAKPGTGCIIRG